ncbi:unnamed protein product, partial [Discosporangium mesarthrocarpum]
ADLLVLTVALQVVAEPMELGVTWWLSLGCLADVGFHGRLLMATLGPPVTLALLFILCAGARPWVSRPRETSVEQNLHRVKSDRSKPNIPECEGVARPGTYP